MRIFCTIFLAALLAAPAVAATSYHTLYVDLGGYSGISGDAHALASRLSRDPALAPYFRGISVRQRSALANYAAEYACRAAGGGCSAAMPDWMQHLHPAPPSERQIDAGLADLRATLAARGLSRSLIARVDRALEAVTPRPRRERG